MVAATDLGRDELAALLEQQRRMGEELGALLDVNRAVSRHLERDQLFGALAASLSKLIETDRFGIELPIEGERLQGHLLTPRGPSTEPTVPTVLPAAGTACAFVLENREWIVTHTREELRTRFPITWDVMSQGNMESLVAMPLQTGERCRGVLFFMAARPGAYRDLRRGLLEQVASAVAVALDDCLAHEEVRQLRDRLAAENRYLQEEIRHDQHPGDIVGESPAWHQVLALVSAVAPTSSTVLIVGETGTGKELVARAVHDASPRRERPLVKLNCAAISPGLVESELFGHVKGAFTGALTGRTGRFELADGGTIFLDEVGELPLDTQVKLLRVLQEREIEPVGSSETRRVDVRVIAATNRNLEQEVAAGRFRADLFFRLNVLPIRVPPLRERREDLRLLVYFFVDRFARQMAKPIDAVAPETLERLLAYAWPGNVRELQNVIERAMVLTHSRVLELAPELFAPAELAASPPAPVAASGILQDVTRQHVLDVLDRCHWLIEGAEGAAARLGLSPSTLRSRMKKLGIVRSRA
jgi:formate hydrogenlyase transcriptional activator